MTQAEKKEIVRKNEEDFQRAMKEWTETQSKAAWADMMGCIQFCCSNIAKKLTVGVKGTVPEFDGKILDSTLAVMQKIRDGERPAKLSSFCYLPTLGVVYDRKTAFFEKQRNLSEIEEKREIKCVNSGGYLVEIE